MRERPRVLVTRAAKQASSLADMLRAMDAEPVVVPVIETVALESYAVLDEALRRLAEFDWLVFTSANAVRVLGERLTLLEIGSVWPRVAVIGPATAKAVEELGVRVALVAERAVAESLAEALLPFARRGDGTATRFLMVRAEHARDVVPGTLRTAGAKVTIAPAYRTVVPAGAVEALRRLFKEPGEQPDAVTFTSSSSARNFFELLAEAGLSLPIEVVRASIGPITSATLREFGVAADVEASEATVESLARAVMGRLRLRR